MSTSWLNSSSPLAQHLYNTYGFAPQHGSKTVIVGGPGSGASSLVQALIQARQDSYLVNINMDRPEDAARQLAAAGTRDHHLIIPGDIDAINAGIEDAYERSLTQQTLLIIDPINPNPFWNIFGAPETQRRGWGPRKAQDPSYLYLQERLARYLMVLTLPYVSVLMVLRMLDSIDRESLAYIRRALRADKMEVTQSSNRNALTIISNGVMFADPIQLLVPSKLR